MPEIKRYSNRKLYDTELKQYVTLEDLAEYIRKGEDVHVIDHETGQDLTSTTLMQVLFEEQKKIGGLLPQVYLTRLISAGGHTVNSLRERLSGLDPFPAVDDEINRRLKALVETGKLSNEEGQRMQELLVHKSTATQVIQIPVQSDEEIPVAEEAVNPEEVDALLRHVEQLEQELSRLQAQ